MTSNIHKSLKKTALAIDLLVPLSGNPRIGNVEAIMASYKEFGQMKPIVVRSNSDDTFTVIAGNHQLEAAKRLGWTEIAAVVMDADDKRALAFAMADNRTMELGHTDEDLLADILSQISTDYIDLLDSLEYDAFEIAAIEIHSAKSDSVLDDGYIPATIVKNIPAVIDTLAALADKVSVSLGDDGESKIEAKPEIDASVAVTTGSTSVGAAGTHKAVVQYTLVFDDADQQRKWYSFIRWLRTSPVYEGETTAERLMAFVDAHSNVEG